MGNNKIPSVKSEFVGDIVQPVFPEINKKIELKCGTIHYREIGSGEPIVFIHGLFVNGFLWRKVVPLLADKYRCIVPDLPLGAHVEPMSTGADLTPGGLATLIGEFIQALNLGSVIVVANDTGGALTQITLTRYPQYFSRVIFTNCDAFDNFLPPSFQYLQTRAKLPGYIFLLSQALRFRKIRLMPHAFGRLAKYSLADEALNRYLLPLIRKAGVRRDLRKVLQGISIDYTLEAAKSFSRFERPVLLAWAIEDKIFPIRHAQMLAELFPDARIEPIHDSWAFIAEDQPQKLVEAILPFLQSTSPRQT